jgi:glycerophosphoryl diester phosphodiesterase
MYPFLTTHSSANNKVPNSKEYMKSCIGSNAKYIEVDVRKTKDNILVLYHNSTIETKTIIDTNYDELLKIDPNLVKIEYAINFALDHGFLINFDLKTIEAAEILAKYIEKYNFTYKCVISGCHQREAKLLLSLNNHLKIIYNLEKEDILNIDKVVQIIVALKVYGINLNYHLCCDSLFNILIKTNLPIFVWTVDSDEAFKLCQKYPITSITSNYPSLYNKYYGNADI